MSQNLWDGIDRNKLASKGLKIENNFFDKLAKNKSLTPANQTQKEETKGPTPRESDPEIEFIDTKEEKKAEYTDKRENKGSPSKTPFISLLHDSKTGLRCRKNLLQSLEQQVKTDETLSIEQVRALSLNKPIDYVEPIKEISKITEEIKEILEPKSAVKEESKRDQEYKPFEEDNTESIDPSPCVQSQAEWEKEVFTPAESDNKVSVQLDSLYLSQGKSQNDLEVESEEESKIDVGASFLEQNAQENQKEVEEAKRAIINEVHQESIAMKAERQAEQLEKRKRLQRLKNISSRIRGRMRKPGKRKEHQVSNWGKGKNFGGGKMKREDSPQGKYEDLNNLSSKKKRILEQWENSEERKEALKMITERNHRLMKKKMSHNKQHSAIEDWKQKIKDLYKKESTKKPIKSVQNAFRNKTSNKILAVFGKKK